MTERDWDVRSPVSVGGRRPGNGIWERGHRRGWRPCHEKIFQPDLREANLPGGGGDKSSLFSNRIPTNLPDPEIERVRKAVWQDWSNFGQYTYTRPSVIPAPRKGVLRSLWHEKSRLLVLEHLLFSSFSLSLWSFARARKSSAQPTQPGGRRDCLHLRKGQEVTGGVSFIGRRLLKDEVRERAPDGRSLKQQLNWMRNWGICFRVWRWGNWAAGEVGERALC